MKHITHRKLSLRFLSRINHSGFFRLRNKSAMWLFSTRGRNCCMSD